ncbi:MAG TPA: heparin lyase I family protein [Tepidisphaeraceae bacterium]|nr:heparin lyase I family protein [Tepidisphaeraceae bacterium]
MAKRNCTILLAVLAVVARKAQVAHATLYTDITANNAAIDSSGDVVENGVTYLTVFKPVPPTSNIHYPWISTNGGYTSNDALAYEIDPSPAGDTSSTDKVDTRVSHADDSTALTFDSVKYLGFAVNIPAANFAAQVSAGDTGVQIAQWWQGSPYSPPLALDLTGSSNGAADYELIVHNDTTMGNPSSTPVVLMTGTIPFDSWNTFVVETDMDYSGDGQVALWENGTELVDWTGAVGYNPSTIPYKNPPEGTANPNQNFDVFIGPYRTIQDTQQQELFDDVRWANTQADATPVPQAEVVLSSGSLISAVSDGDIGGSLSSGLSFSGGELAVLSSFTTGRAITISGSGGTMDLSPGQTLGIGSAMTWSGGTLHLIDSGRLSIAIAGGTNSVAAGSQLNIGTGSNVIVGGAIDPFTDSSNSSRHVTLVNNGSLTFAASSTIAAISGAGALNITNGTLQLAPGGGQSTLGSLSIQGTSALDISNNTLLIDYSSGIDPISAIPSYLDFAQIISSTANHLDASQSQLDYAIGYADGADGIVAGLSSGEIEIMPTLAGDAKLQGNVVFGDFQLLAEYFGRAGGWDEGNFSYFGTIDFGDFQMLAQDFGADASALTAQQIASLNSFASQFGSSLVTDGSGFKVVSVPEPSAMAAVFLAGGFFVSRLRRKSNSRK